MNKGQLKENLPHIIVVAILFFILIFSLVNFGYMRCDDIPGFCSIYYGIKGKPRVAIVHGDGAMGNPERLKNSMPKAVGKFPAWIDIDSVKTKGLLDDYQLVVVEGPKEIPTQSLKVFTDYVQKGGRLVWVGNAGTELSEQDHLCREPSISYLPGAITNISQNKSVEQCGANNPLKAGTK